MADQKKAPAYQGGEIFLLKMGEIVLKGLNRRKFEDRLTANISRRIHKYGRFRIYARQSTVYVEPLEASCDLERAWAAIQPVFGVAGLSRAKACEKDKDAFFETASTYLHDQLMAAKTFKVESKRADKSFPMTSIELSQYVGGMIHDAYPHLKVDVHDPEFTIHLEVRDFSGYVHGNPTPGAGGLPVGAGGRGVALLSGGIDSPVAAYMMAKRGLALDMVHFFSYPYTSLEAKEKVLELAKEITPYTGRLTVHIVPFTEVQEELQPLFDQCIQDAIDGKITRLDSLWPPVVVSSEGAPFEVWQLLRTWTEAQRAETLDAEKAIAFSENLRRQSRWGEIDHHLLDMLQRELQEKYFIVTGNEDDHFWDREYSLKPGIRAEEVPEPLLRFACYVAVSYKVYGMDFQYLDANYLFGLVEKVRPDMVKKLRENGTGRLPISLQKRKTEHFTASANDAFAVIRITARDNTEECCREVLNYLCELLEQEDFPRSYAVEFKGPEKRYLPITGLPKKGVNQLFACAVQYPGLHPLMERYARLAMRQYEQYTNLSDEQCALPGSFAVFALGMLGQEWQQLVWDYLDLCDDEHSHLQEKFLREYVKQFGFTADTVPVFVRGVLSMQNMKYSKDYAAWMANAESLDALLEAKIHLSEIVPSGFSSDEDDDEDEEPAEETEASPEEVLQYAWETVCYVIWGKASAKGGQKVVEAASEELKELYRQIFIPITENLEGSGGLL